MFEGGEAAEPGAAHPEARPGEAMHSGADAVVEALVAAGVEIVFGYPGGTIMPIYDALYRNRNRLRHVLVRHEQAAAHAAEGYARAGRRVGVCMGTSGPGATNLLTGLADAMMDSTPIVAITGQVPSPLLGTDAFQEADIVAMSLPVTKWSYQVTDPAEIPGVMRRAFEVAASGRPGPVLVDVTKDAQVAASATPRAGVPVCALPATPRLVRSDGAPVEPLSRALERAAELLDRARRPYLLLGQGVLLAEASPEAVALAEKLGCPVACTLLGLSAIPTDHPQYVGLLGMHGNYGANVLTNEADVILAVGMRFDDRVTGRLDGYAPHAEIVHIDVDPAEIGKNVPPAVGIVADAGEALRALTPLVSERHHPRWLAEFRRHDRIEHEALAAALAPSGPELGMAEVVARLAELTGGDAVLVTDVGQHQMHAARHFGFRHPRTHVTSGGLGTMGFALPAALGASFAAPGRPVVAIAGDGGFQMNIQELGTWMQEGAPVKAVILNNEHLGMVRQWQELFFDCRYSEVRLSNPDFVQVAAGYRIPAERVEARADLAPALQRMLAADGPYLLDVAVAMEENVFPMVAAGDAIDQIRLD